MRIQTLFQSLIAVGTLFTPGLFAAVSVTGLSFDQSSVDVLNGDQIVTATLQVSTSSPIDGNFSTLYLDSGLNDINAPLGASQPCAPPAAGCQRFSVSLVIPQGTPAGAYVPMLVLYVAGMPPSVVVLDNSTLQAAGITATLTVTDAGNVQPTCMLPPLQPPPAGGGISDTTPPQLVGVCLSPYDLDTRNGGALLTITLNITDDLSGFAYGWFYLSSPSGNQYYQIYFDTSSLIQGNPNSGIYQLTQWFSPGAEAGAWSYSMNLSDRVTNTNYPTLPPDASPLNVTSNPDTQPPVWVSASFGGPVDASNSPATVPVSIHITDDSSGFNGYGNSYIQFQSPSGKQQFYFYFSELQSSGTPNDSVWTGNLTIPRYSEAGNWRINSVVLQDAAGNSIYMSQYGSEPAPSVVFTVTDANADLSGPQYSSLSFTPGAVNTSLSDATVNLSLAFSDSPAGLNYCYLYFTSPSGQQYRFNSNPFGSISGNANGGVWHTSVVLPQYSEVGTWTVYYVYCIDKAYNTTLSLTAELRAKGFPTTLIVIQPSLQPDGTFDSSSHTIHDSASNTVLSDPGGELNGTTVAIDVLAQPPANEPPQGFSIGTGFVSVNLTPPVTTPLAPPGLTLTLTLVNQMLPGTELALYKIDLTSGHLVPVPKAGGGFVTGIVGAGGQSATFTGIATFSTVVGLVPPAKPGDLNSDGVVNCADIQIIRNSWAKKTGQVGFDMRADYNRDGVVNIFDLAAVSKQLPRGTKCP